MIPGACCKCHHYYALVVVSRLLRPPRPFPGVTASPPGRTLMKPSEQPGPRRRQVMSAAVLFYMRRLIKISFSGGEHPPPRLRPLAPLL